MAHPVGKLSNTFAFEIAGGVVGKQNNFFMPYIDANELFAIVVINDGMVNSIKL